MKGDCNLWDSLLIGYFTLSFAIGIPRVIITERCSLTIKISIKKLLSQNNLPSIINLLGILILIDEDIRRYVMDEEKIIKEALRDIGETLGYDKLLKIFAEEEDQFIKALRTLR